MPPAVMPCAVNESLAGNAFKSQAVSDVQRGKMLLPDAVPLYVKGLPLIGEGGDPEVTVPLPVYLTT